MNQFPRIKDPPPPSSPASPSHSRSSSTLARRAVLRMVSQENPRKNQHPLSFSFYPASPPFNHRSPPLPLYLLAWQVTTARGMAARAVHSNNHLVDEDSGGCGSGGGGRIAKANEHGRAAGADGVQIGLRLPTLGDRPPPPPLRRRRRRLNNCPGVTRHFRLRSND